MWPGAWAGLVVSMAVLFVYSDFQWEAALRYGGLGLFLGGFVGAAVEERQRTREHRMKVRRMDDDASAGTRTD
jgi:uncharacterized membrane protein YraQ (UPF0718 family)